MQHRTEPEETPRPRLGARVVDGGVAFAVRSQTAEAIEVCLPTASGERRVPLRRDADGLWTATAPGVRPGDRYGLRAHGLLEPAAGRFFDPGRLLVDPYARAIDGDLAVVVDPPAWDPGPRPRTPWADTVLHELHVRGHTRLHPAVPPALRGTYAGLAHPAVLEGLRELGVTAIELLPVCEHRTEAAVAARGLTNYWGYSTLGFLAPHAAYSASGARGGQIDEFRGLVRACHEAGLEVLVDVVFNHTCEGGTGDPPRSFRGLDNPAWYWLDPADPGRYVDVSGCGNSLDPESPAVQELVLETLRTWVVDLGVDGFRFDLAVWLGRTRAGFAPDAPLLRMIADDPLLRGTKLIAEPWDLGPGGYRVGGFPAPFVDWNGIFRDDVRDVWRGQSDLAALARRLAGSQDVFAAGGRGPLASVNLVTAHDGFTLADLVAYDRKHNEENREGGRDGEDHNRSWNSGVEGPTDDPTVLDQRGRRQRGLLATLLVALGVPMLLAGDERGRSQGGNNNAYCQDGPVAWTAWERTPAGDALLACTRRLIALRRDEPLLRRDAYLGDGDVAWLGADGSPLAGDAWHDPAVRTLQMRLRGAAAGRADLLVVLNPGPGRRDVALPGDVAGWAPLVDTGSPDGAPADGTPRTGTLPVDAWGVVVLRATA